MPALWETLAVLVLGLHVMSQAVNGDCPAIPRCRLHQLKNGTSKCCLKTECPPGTFSMLCEHGNCHEEARCLPCPDGTYRPQATESPDMQMCIQKTPCSQRARLVSVDEGDSMTDRTCKCDINNGYYKLKPSDPYCLGHKECPPGMELNGTSGECVACKYWMFKPDNSTGRCRVKTDCGGKDKYAHNSGHDTTRDNICLNITLPPQTPSTTPVSLPVKTGNEGGLSGEHKAMIGGCLAGVVTIVIIIVLVVIIRRRHRDVEESVSDLPEKVRPPDDSDTDSGHGSFRRQNSTDSVDSVNKFLLNNPKKQDQQLQQAPPPGTPGKERPRIHIPRQRQGSDKSNHSIKTPDSGVEVCTPAPTPGPGGLAYDVEMDSEPTPSPGLKERCPLQTKAPSEGTPGRTIIQVNGPNCTVHVGDKKTIIHRSRERLDDDDNTDYEVQEIECS